MRDAGLKTKKERKLGPINIMLSISLSFSYFMSFQGFRKTQKESTASIFFFRCVLLPLCYDCLLILFFCPSCLLSHVPTFQPPEILDMKICFPANVFPFFFFQILCRQDNSFPEITYKYINI